MRSDPEVTIVAVVPMGSPRHTASRASILLLGPRQVAKSTSTALRFRGFF